MTQNFLLYAGIHCFCCSLPWPLVIKFFYFIPRCLQTHKLFWVISWPQKHVGKPWSWPILMLGEDGTLFGSLTAGRCYAIESTLGQQANIQTENLIWKPHLEFQKGSGMFLFSDFFLTYLNSYYSVPIPKVPHRFWRTQEFPNSHCVSSKSL